MDKNEFLAVEVMGWQVFKEWGNGVPIEGVAYNATEMEAIVFDWNPFENISQSMMLLEKFEVYTKIENNGINDWYCWIQNLHDDSGFAGLGWGKAPAEAICEAVLQASGYYKSPLR